MVGKMCTLVELLAAICLFNIGSYRASPAIYGQTAYHNYYYILNPLIEHPEVTFGRARREQIRIRRRDDSTCNLCDTFRRRYKEPITKEIRELVGRPKRPE